MIKKMKVSQTCRIHLIGQWRSQYLTSYLTCHSVTLFVCDVPSSNRHVVVVTKVRNLRKEFSNPWSGRVSNPRRRPWLAFPASKSWTRKSWKKYFSLNLMSMKQKSFQIFFYIIDIGDSSRPIKQYVSRIKTNEAR